ncbi:unnamed protein product [Peniophora sp. CBMAI 1063]|nr:unnamed protein product [Peniophora sp. CBMAI 1063]
MSSSPIARSRSPSLKSVSDFADDDGTPSTQAIDDTPVVIYHSNTTENTMPSDARESKEADSPDNTTIEPARLTTDPDAFGAKHERYFFDLELLTFSVQGTLYRIHSQFFTQFSTYWATRLANAESNNYPLILDDVNVKEIDALLSILYPVPQENPRTLEDWQSILRLATMWGFKEQRNQAITALEPRLSPLQRLCLARAHGIEIWVHPAFVAMILRPKTLSLAEAEQLSLQDTMHIMTAREALYQTHMGTPPQGVVSEYVAQHIHKPIAPLTRQTPPPPARPSGGLFSNGTQPSQKLTLSDTPTVDEKKTFAKLFSSYQLSSALCAVQSSNIPAFCDLLVEFSSMLKPTGCFSTLLSDVLSRGAVHQSFIPIGTQLLKAVILKLPPAPAPSVSSRDYTSFDLFPKYVATLEVTQAKAKSDIKSYFDDLEKFQLSVERAMTKYGDFTLAFTSARLAEAGSQSSSIFGGPSLFGGRDVDQSDYKKRSANLRTFAAALTEVGLLGKQVFLSESLERLRETIKSFSAVGKIDV